MPMYTYKCPKCDWAGDRIVKVADRDAQRCTSGRPTNFRPVGDAWKDTTSEPCDGQLLREEIALNADMGHFWQP